MKENNKPSQEVMDTPYPIMERFTRRIVPVLLMFIVILLFTTSMASKTVLETIYIQLATIRAEGIAHGVKRITPDSWAKMLAEETLDAQESAILRKAFEDEGVEFRITKIKVYNINKTAIYATDPKIIGVQENGTVLAEVITNKKGHIESKTLPDGQELYELYVPIIVNGKIETVFELYEPASLLDSILVQSSRPVIIYPGALFFILIISLIGIVRQAQKDIDNRTNTINRLRERLESLVSRSAVDAVRRTNQEEEIQSELVENTLFYSDIRSFTSFSQKHTPREVIDFLNKIIGLQVEIIHECEGDVDKMIGDAVLARFQGQNRHSDAIQAADRIQTMLFAGNYPRGIGIGIYSGQIIAGGIGPKNRLDYTIIGDAVNVSARLCTLAKEGEIVVDSDTLKLSTCSGFGNEESVSVKGRVGNLKIHKKTFSK
ncbi:MAG: adenylate/guanylate cyclase domain-containing protein [Magnetococcales bacterium]|nr:adenylate/guanylate cyclase domain-containing protein [Magnetococcales bacterium]